MVDDPTPDRRPRWRRWLRQIPAVDRLAQRLFSPSFEGAWLYRQDVVSWLYDRELRRQLPWPYRTFAAFAALQRPFWDDVVWGYPFVRAAGAVSRRLGHLDAVPIAVGDRVAHVSLRDPRFLQVPNELASDRADTRVLRHFLRPGDSFVDIGANHGTFSIVAAHLVGAGGALVAVEPQPRLAALVGRSLEANAPDAARTVLPVALGDAPGVLRLHVPRGSSGSATALDTALADADVDTFEVPVRRLDDALDWRSLPGAVFVKLDVEGAEGAVLRGATDFVAGRAPTLMMEINPSRIASADGSVALLDVLRALGYTGYAELDAPHDVRPLDAIGLTPQRNVILLHGAAR